MNIKRSRRPGESVVLIVALALVLFATPVVFAWAHEGSPWYLVYLLWLFVIGLGAWRTMKHRPDDH